MKKFASLVLGLALLPAASAFAGAQFLYTAPAMHIYPTNQTLYCDIINIGKKSPQVTIEILDYYGNVTSGPASTTLTPNTGNALGETTPLAGAFCRFTILGAAKKDLRGVAVYDNASAYTIAIPAQ
jgi:hypothetical protein